jgi:probable aminopeptidase NPEPL1
MPQPTRITFSDTAAAALKGKDHVVLMASEAAFKAGVWKKVFKGSWTPIVDEMLKDASAGPTGRAITSFVRGGKDAPRKVTLGLLPDAVSRHNSPSRSHAINGCSKGLGEGKAGVVLCLDDPSHYLPAANAIGRTQALQSRKTDGGAKKKTKAGEITIAAINPAGKAIKTPADVKHVVEATRWAAGLVDLPTAEMHADDFVTECKKALKGVAGVKIQAIVGKDLLTKGLRGLHGVGRAANVAPRLLIMEYSPRKKTKRHVALVGKGVVYDTGGLNIKVGGFMAGMKCDMGGGAAVAGAFVALARGKAPLRVTCLVPLAENAVGPDSYRPDDVLTMHSGKTVEINNTDAEGRLLLADGVSYAARHCKPDAVIDAATLTGAQLVATGKKHAAVVSNREGLERLAVSAGRASGDLTHPLPFAPEFYQSEFKSEFADMCNSVKDRANAQSSCAGQFVYSHMQDTNLPWLHIDLAGPAFPGRVATGFGVALIAALARGIRDEDLEE